MVSKKEKKTIGISLGIIALILVVAAIFTGTGPFAVTSGVTVLSIDEPNIISEDQDLRQLNWLVTTRLGGAENIQFRLTPSDMESQTGTASTKVFTATATSVQETLEYNINLQNDFDINKYTITDITSDSVPCPANTIYTIDMDRFLFGDKRFCVVQVFDGRYGTLSNPTTKFSAELTISNGASTPIKKTITSDATSVSFTQNGQTIGTASWQGSLVTGNPEPDVPDIAILTTHTSNRWRFLQTTQFSEYRSAEREFLNNIERLVDEGFTTTTSYNNLRADLLEEVSVLEDTRKNTLQQYQSISTDFNLLNPTSTSQAKLTFNPEVRLTNPVVTWWIRADWIGVERLVTQPRITKVTSAEFGNNEQGVIQVTVKNDGNGAGQINGYLNSCSNYKQTFTALEYPIAGGETKTIPIYVDPAATNNDISESCEVCVKDVNNPDKFDCDTVTVKFSATKVCTANQYSVEVSENAIYQCNSDGLDRMKVADCDDEGQNYEAIYTGDGLYGGYECIDQTTPSIPACSDGSDNDGDGFIDMADKGCTNPLDKSEVNEGGTFSPVILVIAILLGLVAGGITFAYTGMLRKKRGLVILRWLLVIGVTIGVFILVALIVRYVIDLFTFFI